jgi:heme/copper-type cytochrome/quinol oxidase subunit 2
MNITVLMVGLIVLAMFILPFYFITRYSSKNPDEQAPESTHDKVDSEKVVRKHVHRKA